jgi:hypothetical protein
MLPEVSGAGIYEYASIDTASACKGIAQSTSGFDVPFPLMAQ